MPETPTHDPPEDTSLQTLARIRFDLHWQSEDATHADSRVASRLDLCRDFFPPESEAEIIGRPAGHRAILRVEPVAWLLPPSDDLLRDLQPGIRPFEVFREVARVLKSGGRFILTFSNRWFPQR